MNTPTIITNRLILRKFNLNDIEAFYRIYQDEKVNTFLPWFPLKSLEEAKDFFNERYQSVYDQ
ncbi:GNAT family N-acetyltransferase, partial [Thomasclavelia sp.]|uniref:GNAT family N-acetyltransferase n=1 Tax=Thomasclavelia sp. TaxID=3025757 RepID=UPI0025CDDA13